jgi:hypothetical protein
MKKVLVLCLAIMSVSEIALSSEPAYTLVSENLGLPHYSASYWNAAWMGPENAFNGSFDWNATTMIWTSGQPAPQWIEVDLGESQNVAKVLLCLEQYPAGNTTQEIYVSNSPILNDRTGATLVHTFTGYSASGDIREYVLPAPIAARYVQVYCTEWQNYVALREVQVFVPETYRDPELIPYGSVNVDGDLSDWSNATWSAIDQVLQDNPADISEASYSVKWQANKIYLAVKVLDTVPYFTNTYTAWDARDAIEIFLHTDGKAGITYPDCEAAQEYIVGIKDSYRTQVWSALGNGSMYRDRILEWSDGLFGGLGKAAGSASVTAEGCWINYEVELTPFTYLGVVNGGTNVVSTLGVGDVIGLDVDVVGHNTTGYTGVKCENQMAQKSANLLHFGLHKLNQFPGDANNDGKVDVGDLGILAANYGSSNKTWNEGDFNKDGKVDVGDLGILAANYGTNASGANFEADYAKVFDDDAAAEEESSDAEETTSSICSGLGLSMIAGLMLMSLMLVKLDE